MPARDWRSIAASMRMISSRYVAGQRLDVGAVGHLRIGHDGGRIGVGQHHLVAFRLERLAGLRAGVVELGRLADDDRARSR